MLVIIDIKPLRLNTLWLMHGKLWEYVTFETLIQLYFDSQQRPFDIRDLVVGEFGCLDDNQLQEIWNAVSEFQNSTNEYMHYFVGDKIAHVSCRDVRDSVLSLEYWKPDEFKDVSPKNPYNSRHWSLHSRIPVVPRI